MRLLISTCVSLLLLLVKEITTSISDPCYNYHTIDDYWRNIQKSRFPYYYKNDDTLVEWSGWYRLYLNGQSGQMSEWCVNYAGCGGYTGLFLSGSHPTLEDGVVTRDVLGSYSWSDQCGNYRSTSIQVKACPGDYYVYELVKPDLSIHRPSYCAASVFQNISHDPCYNYESLDRPWRANNETKDSICDESFSWSGWYRLLYYGMNIQMAETCVSSYYGCNTNVGLWINGPHPQIEDGVVIREVCGGVYWGGCCDYKSISIRVKACPGNYYVYELVSPPGFCGGYCTDVSTISQVASTVSPDIITESSVTWNFDPCKNYNILDNYWRSTYHHWYTDGYVLEHDDTRVGWDGWYRLFINGQSAQMPEWCVSTKTCGGVSGLYLGGSHPQLEDKVVTREIYGSLPYQCNRYRSDPIQVKACPGDYYVYKFTRPSLSIPAPVYCAVVFQNISSDPCYNYESLDHPWRANNETGEYICDQRFSWSGWYRLFYYGMNIQLSETCVSSYSCGTEVTLWINGPHPQIEDGVVIREVCGSYFSAGCCHYKSNPIRVKACPGNYYVYELVSPPGFCGGYCIDVSTISQVVSTVSPDIITRSSITWNFDPCNNYSVLDSYGRRTINYWSFYGPILEHDDTRVEWDGWYRLIINGSSAQMPEWCVYYMFCGGFSGLWLGGSHPQLEDGVVTREIYGQCSRYRSDPIQVKACPGDYYVYKFTRPSLSIPVPAYCAVSFNTPSVDPCYNYTSLDEFWRNYLYYSDYLRLMCDYNVEWNGWYRLFYNTQSAQMPESCVSRYMCGTENPLWLNGSHPELEDGVVLRQVCASEWSGCCTHTSHPIRVKACPGDYYVYEFVKPKFCSAYCSVPSQARTSMSKTTETISSKDSITPPLTTIAPPVEPCTNYNVLDDAWRATSNRSSSQPMCDTAVRWSGWYRLFIQGQSVEMPDTCVDQYSCGTDAPLWLSGGHPAVEDGVVTRDVCGHWSNNCCYFRSNPIKVKACPGGYYVYAFVRPTTCSLAYCAETRNIYSTYSTVMTETTTAETSTTETESTTSISDPCYNYNITDDYWRNIQNSPYRNYNENDDTLVEWSGWYRMYLNGQSAQMSEWCVTSAGCGGYTGLYLSGSHPTLEDGVVTRDVLGTRAWSNQCGNYRSTSIQVKACPGDYYVYELVKPDLSIYKSSYCAVVFQNTSSDPCYNYESLDRPWRANNETIYFICDNYFSWSGWYRLYYYGMNIQMPETCVSSGSCNTGISLWINGSHPQIEDGVVIREVCGSIYWGGCCYYKSNPIRVKACPGNYYVYELVTPPVFCEGYCTDVSTISQVVSTVSPDIITGSSITWNFFDPCNDYNILDNYWRNPSFYRYMFDNVNLHDDTRVEWNGWYRLFINGSSAQMSEWCVYYMSCGGVCGLYLGGSHPQLEDGVVTREIYGSCYDKCSGYRSDPIQVKACPGDYYVYKFTRPSLSIPAPVYCAAVFQNISSDPCYNYESLDRPWRANNETGDYMCDERFSWNGWYRLFYYGKNIQIAETCVSSYSCNAYISLWINGRHPHIEDGVVIREVCGSYNLGCCYYKSNPIRVKACPGNYYVYELVNPLSGGCGGYCTDVSTISQVVSTVSPDIITGSSITWNYDPCNNYTILDNYWRSTHNYWSFNGYMLEHDDTRVEWDGWYRLFINGESAQMPDWCMTYMSCGSYVSLWLGGSHPQLEDEVVTREVYGSRYDQCSRYRSDPIQVKACPGDYYVYKFTRPSLSIPAPVYCAVPFSTPSVDPCYNYTSLDELWRSTDNTFYNDYYRYGMCDYNVEWNGWYRLFYNNQSAQIPESCVNEGMCGTYHPLWLNSPHPELEDGVVTRHVCASIWSSCCGLTSHPIRVKACPGDYYVYEFVKPLFCSAYCADVPTQSSTSVSTTTETISSIESITPPNTTTAAPVEPCNNYNVLDDPWRATSNRSSSQPMCDIAVRWNGWYRLFIQGQSVEMPDTCVDQYSCGTDAPLWLSGGHPAVEDGVVTRDVCGHWSNNCCHFQSNPIKVKACPGGYYVYEFVRPTSCNLAYCAESTTSLSDPCYNYNITDDYFRNINQNPFQYYYENNDTNVEWSGWYRLYLNGQSAQMSEWCVTSNGCGGYTGLFLSGSHPTLEDGVVTCDVLGTHVVSGQCGNHRSTSIQVKACPGDYYVYELVKPNISVFGPSYCAVVFQNISSDPCYNYESLDHPWRANNETGDSVSDKVFSWSGWYRLFYYGMNIQMPETCVSPGSCNTGVSLWINGRHPQIEDGVVIREVCGSGNWGGCCYYKSNPIRVKACPGNYYVYELVSPQMWCSGYCTDISTISQGVSTVSPDIITGSSVTLNFDPCNNYNILDSYERSTRNYWSFYEHILEHDDTRVKWDGWYRLFINGSNAQMPDWCVPYMSCGGVIGLYLGGSHPQLEDGVVTRDVYGSHYYQCSLYRSDPIQVKACPGDYYVYKFTRPSLSIPAPAYCAVPFSTPSVDPCYNYTSLDELWRSTNNYLYNNYYQRAMCDYNVEWNGWYRLFYNNQSAQMPESCVSQYMCGTDQPLWLNGSHPELEDGVVTRQVCASRWSSCCMYTSHPIRVKACPGDYYVYEFVKPLFCSAYCTVPSQSRTSVSTTTETISSIESITPPITTTAAPVEPCYNYNVLDDPWRATSNRSSSQPMCDTGVNWSGWYRLYIQGQSVEMPDTCVDQYSCGTDAPLWLSGGHPAVEDGVVTRDVCGHWSNNCCHFQSNPIKVKACPGGYYVYEFVRPTTCSLAYCADVRLSSTVMPETTTTETTAEATTETPAAVTTLTTVNRNPCSELNCSGEERCGMKNGVYGCLCKKEHHRRQSSQDAFDFSETCEGSSGSMSVSRCQLFEAGFPADNLHLNDPSCRGTVQNGRVEFHFDNDQNICGTNLVANGTHFNYINFIMGTPKAAGLISRQKILKISFSCVYPQTQKLSMNVEINPLESNVIRPLPGQGTYKVRMIPYVDEEFTKPFTGKVDAELDQEMHVEVRVDGVDCRQFALVLDTCWATPVNDPDYSLRWDLIAQECPNPDDDTVKLLQNGVSANSRFSFRMFIFTANSTKLYLHCAVHLCLLSSSRCSLGCNSEHHRRKRRSLDFHDSTSLSMGPLVWSGRNTVTDKVVRDLVKVSEASCLCSSLLLMFVPLMSFLTLF